VELALNRPGQGGRAGSARRWPTTCSRTRGLHGHTGAESSALTRESWVGRPGRPALTSFFSVRGRRHDPGAALPLLTGAREYHRQRRGQWPWGSFDRRAHYTDDRGPNPILRGCDSRFPRLGGGRRLLSASARLIGVNVS